jgi:predicted nucleic acid-binding protein
VILVDTDALIDFLSGAEPGATVVEQLLVERRACISSVTVFELCAGEKGKRRLEQLGLLVGALTVHPLSGSMARRAASLYTSLKQTGRLIGNEDVLLAATALDLGVPVLTRNVKHFARIPDLTVIDPTTST